MRGLPQLTLASARMIYRSRASLRVAFLTPLMFAALIALFHELRFETGSQSIDFFSYIAVGVAFWYVTYAAEHGMTGAAAGYRAQGVLKRIAATPISAVTVRDTSSSISYSSWWATGIVLMRSVTVVVLEIPVPSSI